MINEYFYNDIFTFKFKEVAPSFEEFKSKINEYNFFFNYITFDDPTLEIIYYCLITNFCNSWIRQDTKELFYADLVNDIIRVFNKYKKVFELIKTVYEKPTEDLLIDEKETTSQIREGNSKSDSYAKSAETPTGYGSQEVQDYINKYTNAASKSESGNVFDETTTYERRKDFSIVDTLENASKIISFPIDKLAQEFVTNFIQIDDALDFIYIE